MKGVLYYFSGTGNTKWVADRFKENFKSYNIDIDLVDMQHLEDKQLKKCDFVIIGSPVYVEFPPKIVKDFLNKLDFLKEGKRVIIYSTQASASSSVPYSIAKCLKKRGYLISVQVSIKMPNNYYFFIGKKPSKDEVNNLLMKADEKVKHSIENFVKNKKIKENTFFVRLEFNKIAHNIFKSVIPRLSKNINSTKDCDKCGLCLRNCPQGNITFEGGRAIFHSKCILCLRCIHICPINAIRYKNKKIDQTQKNIIKVLDLNK
ncbi:EFR1 family ferrodoxin [Clostridium sp. WILCCON 0269]|uniref:Ferredoxin n=1 Tax=Candidatus Clostridium eludens TaxID=3381663 RepID=A0ABW8SM60_9CLOT